MIDAIVSFIVVLIISSYMTKIDKIAKDVDDRKNKENK